MCNGKRIEVKDKVQVLWIKTKEKRQRRKKDEKADVNERRKEKMKENRSKLEGERNTRERKRDSKKESDQAEKFEKERKNE